MDCVFCKIIAGEIPAERIEETDNLIVIQDRAPKATIHYLIIPKKHYEDLMAVDECCLDAEMIAMARKLAKKPGTESFRLMINNGYAAGQRVFHLHLHFLSGSNLSEF